MQLESIKSDLKGILSLTLSRVGSMGYKSAPTRSPDPRGISVDVWEPGRLRATAFCYGFW